jgi:hypothetical protein
MDFSWDSISKNLQDNAFGDKYEKKTDERFWKLSRDENDNGAAIIRFLLDPDEIPFVRLQKIDAQKGKKSFFVDEWSPASIGMPDPFQEKFSEYWAKGEQETAKMFGRKFRYITNIKVIKDPSNPENNGKIFLFDMSQTLMDKLKNAVELSESQKALGESPVEVYDPIKGENFIIKAKRGSNNIITYEDSKFTGKVDAIYESEAEAEKDILENAYKLGEFFEESFFKTYDELTVMLNKFMGVDKEKTEKMTEETPTLTDDEMLEAMKPKKEAKKTTEAKSDEVEDLDELLAEFQ